MTKSMTRSFAVSLSLIGVTTTRKVVTLVSRGLGLAICAILVFQCLAIPAIVSAQNETLSSQQNAKLKKKKKKRTAKAVTRRPMIVLPPMRIDTPVPVPVPPTVVPASKTTKLIQQQEIKGIERVITILPPVDMAELQAQAALSPKSSGPIEIKPIHPPQGIPEGVRPGALINRLQPKPGSKPREKSVIATIPSPAVSATFKSDNLSLGFIPPDTMGAVGPNHVVTVTNEKVIVHSRTGVVLTSVTLNAFWAVMPNGLAGPSAFDPKILYDRFNDRFIFCSVANASSPTSATLFAVTQTGNPNGVWNRYAIDTDSTATSGGGDFADYPSIGFNNKWITIQINRFGFGSESGYQGPSIYVINKTLAYAGLVPTVTVFQEEFLAGCLSLPTPEAQRAALGCGFTMVPAITETNADTDHYVVEDWDSTAAQLRLSKITGPQAAPALTVGYQFPQSPYSWRFNGSLVAGSGGYLPQRQQNIYLPSGNRPTANDSRIQNAVLRNGSLWTVHTVMLARLQTPAGTTVGGSGNPDIRAGVQWWEINPTITNPASGQPPIQRNIIADPRADNCHNGVGGQRAGCTTATQTGDHFAYATISVNANNDVLIGHSRFSPFTLPKAAYSFRAGTDPANTIRDSMVFREGQGNYNIGAGSPFNIRWGDYSAAMVDPLNDTDFWTIQEYALDQREIFGPGGFAGLWSTWWGLISPSSSAGTYSFANKLIISEFRLRGPNGARDEFVEVYNPTDNPITVFSTDGSDGWTLVYSSSTGTITPLASIPNGTVIPPKGFYLITNEVRATGLAPYSLSAAATGHPTRKADSDAMWTPDLLDNGGIALFRTANQTNFNAATLMDAVGFQALAAGSIYREGAGLLDCTGSPTAGQQVSFKRKGPIGALQDTNDNAADFDVSSTGASAQTCQPLTAGNPTPCNRDAQPANGTNCTGSP